MILGWLAMLIFAFHASTHMVGAGDTWVAMACGRHFINHGVDTVEPFSANSHKAGPTEKEIKTWPNWARWITDKVGIETVRYWHPTGWINQNWLTHVIFYWLTHKSPFADAETFSFNTLVYWKFAIYILTVICVYYTGRVLGVNPALSAVFACFTMFVGRSLLDIRPAGFSNLLVAVFLLILVLTTYRNIFYIWLIVPLAVFWCNVHGGYLYLFIMLVPFIRLHLGTGLSKKWLVILNASTFLVFFIFLGSIYSKELSSFFLKVFIGLLGLAALDLVLFFFRKRFVSIGLKGVYHTVAAGFIAFIAAVVFNPFHLTNLTHTFIISVSEHAKMWRSVNEWHPAFEWNNPVGTAVPFAVMFGIALATLGLWAVVLRVTSRSVSRGRKRKAESGDEYQWPRINLPLMLVAALTIYMAIRSRRFIPIAAIAACPIIAMFIDQMIRAISATRNFHKLTPASHKQGLSVSAMPQALQLFFTLAGAVAVLFFGTWWGLKFKRIYLDPWPTDTKLNSVFMRMTASDAKPFYACKFIKMNKLEGKMFNYWTEGGFIAWGQQPDPNTGRTPLQLFMDGRAQAAYEPRAYELWQGIMSGGQIGRQIVSSARIRKRKLTRADYVKIGRSINEELKNHNVWVVLMPLTPNTQNFAKWFEYTANWPVVFFNNRQKLFVDATTTQGRELFEGIFKGKTLYPDDFSKNLIMAHNILLFGKGEAAKKRGLDFAIKAFDLNPSAAPMVEILTVATRFAELKPQVTEFCKKYFDDFRKNKDDWAKQDGYHHRVEAARLASIHLQNVAQAQKNTKDAKFYAAERKKCVNERNRTAGRKRW